MRTALYAEMRIFGFSWIITLADSKSSTRVVPRSIPSLDGWRAVATTFVILDHLGEVRHTWNTGTGVGMWTDAIVPLGSLGVRIFFGLSGYLICRLLLAERAETGRISLGMFYFRRTFRIAPALFVYLAVLAVLKMADAVPVGWSELTSAAAYVSNYRQMTWLTGHTWSLSVEEQFYAAWPVLLLLTARRAWIAPVIAIAIAPVIRVMEYAHYAPNTWAVQTHFETVADALAAGVCLALITGWLSAVPQYRRWCASPLPWLLVPALLAALHPGWQHPTLYMLFSIPFANLAIVLLIDWTVQRPDRAFGRVLNLATVCWVGRMSYSLYLWQQFTLAFTPHRVPLVLPAPLVLWTRVPGVVIPTFVLAVLSYYGVEQPMLRVRVRLGHWLKTRGRRGVSDLGDHAETMCDAHG